MLSQECVRELRSSWLPNITDTPSCLRIWRNADLPAMYAIAAPMIHFFGVRYRPAARRRTS